MIVLVRFLVLSAVVAGVVGSATLTEATFGVGVIGIGCLLAILARIAQAHTQHAATHAARVEPAMHVRGAVAPVDIGPYAAPRSADISARHGVAAWAVVTAVVLFTASFIIYSALQDAPTSATRGGTGTVAQPPSSPPSARVARTATGWQVDNTTEIGWFDCVAEAGASQATIGEVGPYGRVVLTGDDFVPPLLAGSSDGLEIMCQREAPSR